ncbi:MAG: hypothetical protein ABIG61_01705 [Planctomycetota bacterium]
MAKEDDKEKKLTSEDRTDTVIYDRTGREILRIGFIRSESEDDDGTEFYETVAENLECGDGTVVSPGHLMRPPSQGGVTLQRCNDCQRESRRNRNVNPFSPSTKMRSCFHCRARLCEKHTHIFNNHIVCSRCKRRQFIIHRLLKPIFFRRVKGT